MFVKVRNCGFTEVNGNYKQSKLEYFVKTDNPEFKLFKTSIKQLRVPKAWIFCKLQLDLNSQEFEEVFFLSQNINRISGSSWLLFCFDWKFFASTKKSKEMGRNCWLGSITTWEFFCFHFSEKGLHLNLISRAKKSSQNWKFAEYRNSKIWLRMLAVCEAADRSVNVFDFFLRS